MSEDDKNPDPSQTIVKHTIDTLAISEAMEKKRIQESVTQMLAERDNAETLSILDKKAPRKYALVNFYLVGFLEAVKKWDLGDRGADFEFPDWDNNLVKEDLLLKRSTKEGRIIKAFESVSHVTETNAPTRRGFFGSRK
jgi:hypothetical protein